MVSQVGAESPDLVHSPDVDGEDPERGPPLADGEVDGEDPELVHVFGSVFQ